MLLKSDRTLPRKQMRSLYPTSLGIPIMTTTCATCPLSRQIEGSRYECTSAHKDHVVRSHWVATADCIDAITQHSAQQELDQHIEEQAEEVAPVPPATRLEVYATPDKNLYVVYSFKPKYINPGKYRVRYSGGGLWSCTCPHHQHRHDDPNFFDKHIAAVKQTLASPSAKLQREPVRLTTARGFLKPTFMAWLGDAQLGFVNNQEEGEVLANRFFNSERSRLQMREEILAAYY